MIETLLIETPSYFNITFLDTFQLKKKSSPHNILTIRKPPESTVNYKSHKPSESAVNYKSQKPLLRPHESDQNRSDRNMSLKLSSPSVPSWIKHDVSRLSLCSYFYSGDKSIEKPKNSKIDPTMLTLIEIPLYQWNYIDDRII